MTCMRAFTGVLPRALPCTVTAPWVALQDGAPGVSNTASFLSRALGRRSSGRRAGRPWRWDDLLCDYFDDALGGIEWHRSSMAFSSAEETRFVAWLRTKL